MHPNTRVCVVYVAGALINGKNGSAVYDYSQSKHISISGSVTQSNVNVYDHDCGCHFSGAPCNLYDYGRGAHVSLTINGNHFSGYDYGDGHHFSGTVNGNSVSVYDHGASIHFNYSL